jgi:hypothetical protein
MQKPLATKVRETVQYLRTLWPKLDDKHRFVAFSTGKDSLAMTAMLYEAVETEKPNYLLPKMKSSRLSELDITCL